MNGSYPGQQPGGRPPGRPGWQQPPQSWRPPQQTVIMPRPQQGTPVRSRPDGPPPPAAERGKPVRRKRWGHRVLIALLVLLLALVGFGVYLDRSMARVAALADYAGRPADTPGTNWLIVGSDSRADLTDEEEKRLATGDAAGKRTDTIMLLHSGSGPTTLVSLPRDSYLPIAGHGRNKLNAAFAFGGAPLLVRTVEQATGLRVDHYAEIGFAGFEDVVDAVGGVEMCIPEAIKDPKAALNVKAGCQQLDGATALGYVRTRATARADLERVERQRAFLSALMGKATSVGTLVNPFRMVPMATGLAGAITVDDGDHLWNLLGLGLSMKGLSGGDGVTTTVPVGSLDNVGGQSVVRWDDAQAKALFGALATDQPPPASTISR